MGCNLWILSRDYECDLHASGTYMRRYLRISYIITIHPKRPTILLQRMMTQLLNADPAVLYSARMMKGIMSMNHWSCFLCVLFQKPATNGHIVNVDLNPAPTVAKQPPPKQPPTKPVTEKTEKEAPAVKTKVSFHCWSFPMGFCQRAWEDQK